MFLPPMFKGSYFSISTTYFLSFKFGYLLWYLTVILICIFLMMTDFEHIFTSLLAICIYSLDKCLFKSFAHLIGLTFYCWFVRIFYVFWIWVSCKIMWFANVFSHFFGCPYFLIMSFAAQSFSLFYFNEVQYTFSLTVCVICKKPEVMKIYSCVEFYNWSFYN